MRADGCARLCGGFARASGENAPAETAAQVQGRAFAPAFAVPSLQAWMLLFIKDTADQSLLHSLLCAKSVASS